MAPPIQPQSRPIRIAGCSGSASDRRHALLALARSHPLDPIDVITGDWMSEANMTRQGANKAAAAAAAAAASVSAPSSLAHTAHDYFFEPTFLEALQPALPYLARYGIRVAVNAGASDTRRLAGVVESMVAKAGLTAELKVAWVGGDEVPLAVIEKAMEERGERFENICTGERLGDWKFEPLCAQAYLGGLGIAKAFEKGASIVVCGRVSDASPAIGAAYWWHGWQREDLDCLANAFVAGHLVECSTYVTGGNFTGFKKLQRKGWNDIGYPIAEVSENGEVVITKQRGSGGEVSPDTCTSQLLYEIQGPWYFNSDVTAILDGLWFEQLSTDRVALRGVRGEAPPATTKIGITAKGGFQAEVHWLLVGLDIEAKANMIETQIRHELRPYIHRFSMLAFTVNGSSPENPTNQNAATMDFRVFAQAPEAEDLAPSRFFRPCFDVIMEAYPGATPHLDIRQGFPKPVYEYYVTLLPQSDIHHTVNLWNGEAIDIPPPPNSKIWPKQQPSEPIALSPASLSSFGQTVEGPLGWIVHARSGDKGSNCNVGFWVSHNDEWEWLRSLLSIDTIKQLLADEYKGKPIVSPNQSLLIQDAYETIRRIDSNCRMLEPFTSCFMTT